MTGEHLRVAFDIGGTSTRCAIVDGPHVLVKEERPTVHGDKLADELAAMFHATTNGSDSHSGEPWAVGVSVPGPLTPDRRSVAFTGNVGLRDYPLAKLLQDRIAARVELDDDANCAALGEATFGAARGSSSSVTIVVGTGVGAGIVIDGCVHHGAHSVAGELGHIRVERDGRRCSCGNRGCLEAEANGAALLERAGGNYASAADVFEAARGGDPAALEAIATTARHLATGVAAVASMLDPECIILVGGVGRQQEVVESVRREAAKLCIWPIGDTLDVRPAALGDDAGLVGAALLMAERP